MHPRQSLDNTHEHAYYTLKQSLKTLLYQGLTRLTRLTRLIIK